MNIVTKNNYMSMRLHTTAAAITKSKTLLTDNQDRFTKQLTTCSRTRWQFHVCFVSS